MLGVSPRHKREITDIESGDAASVCCGAQELALIAGITVHPFIRGYRTHVLIFNPLDAAWGIGGGADRFGQRHYDHVSIRLTRRGVLEGDNGFEADKRIHCCFNHLVRNIGAGFRDFRELSRHSWWFQSA